MKTEARRLYLLTREKVNYDENAGFVIQASSRREAREIAGHNSANEGASLSIDARVILSDFKAG